MGTYPTHLLSLIISVGHELRKVSVGKLSFGISRVISVRCLLRFQLPGGHFLIETEGYFLGYNKKPRSRSESFPGNRTEP